MFGIQKDSYLTPKDKTISSSIFIGQEIPQYASSCTAALNK